MKGHKLNSSVQTKCMEELLRPGATTGHTHTADSLKHGELIVTQCCSSHLDLVFAGLIFIS